MTIQYKVPARHVDKELAERLEKLDRERLEIAQKLVEAYRKSPEYTAALHICGSVNRVNVHLGSTSALEVVINDGKSSPAVASIGYMGETTINTLLSGKLLSDEEKRGLLALRFGFGVEGSEIVVRRRVWIVKHVTRDATLALAEWPTLRKAEEDLERWGTEVEEEGWVPHSGSGYLEIAPEEREV